MEQKNKFVVGVWRSDLIEAKLGSFISFLNELYYLSQFASQSRVKFISVGTDPLPSYMQEFIKSIKNPPEVVLLNSVSAMLIYLQEQKIYSVTPSVALNNAVPAATYDYDCFERLKTTYRQNNIRPCYVQFSDKTVNETINYIHNTIRTEKYITLHLKNTSSVQKESNANFSVWADIFTSYFNKDSSFKFVLLGSDSMPSNIAELSNVICVQNHNLSLSVQAHLVQLSRAFLGMSSGPCQFAIFSHTPYLIFKNPDHHADQMSVVLEGRRQLSFANENQFFLQEYESVGVISNFIDGLND